MSYQVFARKYRPQTFADVVGQEHVVQTLENAVRQHRLAHAYLFVGPRGVGKTSTARILAKALNCVGGPKIDFDPNDDVCREIAEGRSLDVLEIDGASNNGVEQVRELRENVRFAPTRGQFKIYIIDEVHMLTTAAFNALLKTLEEPPPHVKFIFATTEPHKVLPTILSRCQRFDLRRITTKDIAEHLGKIARLEHIQLEPRAALAIAKAAEGGMRDAESMLDQLVAFCGEVIEEADVLGIFGLTSMEIVAGLAGEIFGRDNALALESVRGYAEEGKDLMKLLGDLLGYFRTLLIIKTSPNSLDEAEHGEELADVMRRQSAQVHVEQLLALVELFAEAEGRMKWAPNKRLHFEVAVIKAIHQLSQSSIADIVGALTALSRGESAPATALDDYANAKPEVIKPAPPPARKPLEVSRRAPSPSPNPSPDVVPEPKAAAKPAETVVNTPATAPTPSAPAPQLAAPAAASQTPAEAEDLPPWETPVKPLAQSAPAVTPAPAAIPAPAASTQPAAEIAPPVQPAAAPPPAAATSAASAPQPAAPPHPAPAPPAKLEFGDRTTKAMFETLPAPDEEGDGFDFFGGSGAAQDADLMPKFDLGYDNPDQGMLFDMGDPAPATASPAPQAAPELSVEVEVEVTPAPTGQPQAAAVPVVTEVAVTASIDAPASVPTAEVAAAPTPSSEPASEPEPPAPAEIDAPAAPEPLTDLPDPEPDPAAAPRTPEPAPQPVWEDPAPDEGDAEPVDYSNYKDDALASFEASLKDHNLQTPVSAPEPERAPAAPQAAAPQAAAPQPSATAGGTDASAEAEALWQVVRRDMKGVMLRPAIMAGVPIALDRGNLEIAFRTDSDGGVHHDGVWRKREEIEALLSDTAGTEIKLKLTRREDLPQVEVQAEVVTSGTASVRVSASVSGAPGGGNATEEQIMQEFRDDPLIRKALSVFRGEIDGVAAPGQT